MISRNGMASIVNRICAALVAAALVGGSAFAAESVSGTGSTSQFRPVDEAKVKAVGIRKLESRRLVLYTDLPAAPDVDDLPQVFDQAFDLWCKYLGIDPAQHGDWRMRASLMSDPQKF